MINNAYRRWDRVPLPAESVVVSATETFLSNKRTFKANTMITGQSLEQSAIGFVSPGTSLGGVIIRSYLGGTYSDATGLLTGGTLIAQTGSLAFSLTLGNIGFYFELDLDVMVGGANSMIEVQGRGGANIASLGQYFPIVNMDAIKNIDLTKDNLFCSSVQGVGVIVGTTTIVIRRNKMRVTF